MNNEIWVVQDLFGEVVRQQKGVRVALIAEGPKRFVARARAGNVVWRICMHKKKQVEKAWNSVERACLSLAAVGVERVVVQGRIKLGVEDKKVKEPK